jgi:hypothetical protein
MQVFYGAPGHYLSANTRAKSLTNLGKTNAIARASLMWTQKPMDAPTGVGGPSQKCRPLNRIARGFVSPAMSPPGTNRSVPTSKKRTYHQQKRTPFGAQTHP